MTVAPLPLAYAEHRTETPPRTGGGTPKNRESSLLGPGLSLHLEARWSVQQGGVESLSAAASFMGGVRLHWTVGLGSARKTAKCRPGKWWQARSVVTINDPAGDPLKQRRSFERTGCGFLQPQQQACQHLPPLRAGGDHAVLHNCKGPCPTAGGGKH